MLFYKNNRVIFKIKPELYNESEVNNNASLYFETPRKLFKKS